MVSIDSDPPANQVVVVHKRSAPSLHSKVSPSADRGLPPIEALHVLPHPGNVETFVILIFYCIFDIIYKIGTYNNKDINNNITVSNVKKKHRNLPYVSNHNFKKN